MKLLLIRHPAPDIEHGTCYGRLDVRLRPDTGPCIAAIAESTRAHGVGTVWSSPSARCLIPAQAAVALTGTRLRVDPRLRELHFGRWEGARWEDVPRAALDRWAADPSGFAPPGGETGFSLLARAGDLMRTLLAEAADCAVISHGGPLRILRALAEDKRPDLLATPPPVGAIIALTINARWLLSSVNLKAGLTADSPPGSTGAHDQSPLNADQRTGEHAERDAFRDN